MERRIWHGFTLNPLARDYWVPRLKRGMTRERFVARLKLAPMGLVPAIESTPYVAPISIGSMPSQARIAKMAGGRAMLVEPALRHDLALPVVLLLGEALDVVKQHLRVAGQDRTVDMSARIPKRGSDQRLGAVQQCLLDRDDQADLRRTVADSARCQHPRIVGDASVTVDPKRLVHAGHQEQQCNARVDEQVDHAVEPIVSDPVGQQQRELVEHVHKARRIPARRDVGAVWSLRCDYAKRRERNDPSAMLIEPPQYLIRRAAHRRMMQRAQARLVGDEACIVREHAWPRSFNSLLPD